MRCAFALVVLAACGLGCGQPPLRQITVEIWTDLPTSVMDAYQLTVSRGSLDGGAVRFDRCYERLAGACPQGNLPMGTDPLAGGRRVTYAIVPANDDLTTPVSITVRGLHAGNTVIENAATVTFPDRAALLPLPLLTLCAGVNCSMPGWVCDPALVCRANPPTPDCRCRSPVQDPNSLPGLDASIDIATVDAVADTCPPGCPAEGATRCADPMTQQVCTRVGACLEWQSNSCGGVACTNGVCAMTCTSTCNNDGTCQAACGESSCTCPSDCGARCGDGCCNGNETCTSCSADCRCGGSCGDMVCNGTDTACNCPSDGCVPMCGDGCCNGSETACSCPHDCPPTCGDGCCSAGETPCSCPTDGCPSTCGDGCCSGNETACSCPADGCAPSCGDGCCNGMESQCTCADCSPGGSLLYDSSGVGDQTGPAWEATHGGTDWHSDFAQTLVVPAGGFTVQSVTVQIAGIDRPPIDIVVRDPSWIELSRGSLPPMNTTDNSLGTYTVALPGPTVTTGYISIEVVSTGANNGNANFHLAMGPFDSGSCMTAQSFIQGMPYWDTTVWMQVGGTF